MVSGCLYVLGVFVGSAALLAGAAALIDRGYELGKRLLWQYRARKAHKALLAFAKPAVIYDPSGLLIGAADAPPAPDVSGLTVLEDLVPGALPEQLMDEADTEEDVFLSPNPTLALSEYTFHFCKSRP